MDLVSASKTRAAGWRAMSLFLWIVGRKNQKLLKLYSFRTVLDGDMEGKCDGRGQRE